MVIEKPEHSTNYLQNWRNRGLCFFMCDDTSNHPKCFSQTGIYPFDRNIFNEEDFYPVMSQIARSQILREKIFALIHQLQVPVYQCHHQ